MTTSQAHKTVLGIDAGGTFTDFVLLEGSDDGYRISIHKVLSTPGAPERAILQGIEELGLSGLAESGRLHIIHGSTVATNAALEGKGARTAFITNHGFGDLLSIGRQTRPALYALEFEPVPPPVVPELCLETGGRLAADGAVLEPLLEEELVQLQEDIARLKPEAVAVNLLFSFLDDSFEKAVEQAVAAVEPGLFISRSSAVLPEYREYERGVATWLNASLEPVVHRYLSGLSNSLGRCRLAIMQSSGETVGAAAAASRAVNLLLSGPAAGLTAIRYLGRQLGSERFISFDMGGTSTDVALLDGDLKITNEGRIAGYPVAVPMVDMHTIGAGGGSIAFLDHGGMLQVGPESAGADPGPACYGRGGTRVTVTDANLVLGRIPADAALAGNFRLDRRAALSAIEPLAAEAGLDIEAMARGIIDVANENMASALRMISVQRGYHPADFILTCFGGAGGLHVCALAEAMGMHDAVVPVNAGVLSAMGMLVAPQGRQFSRTVRIPAALEKDAEVEAAFEELIELGCRELAEDGLTREQLQVETSIDVCYLGQSSTLNLPWLGTERSVSRFHRLHLERYGFSLEREVELVNLRARLFTPGQQLPPLENQSFASGNNFAESKVSDTARDIPVLSRHALVKEAIIQGPAIITEHSATTFLESGWQARLDKFGNLRLNREG